MQYEAGDECRTLPCSRFGGANLLSSLLPHSVHRQLAGERDDLSDLQTGPGQLTLSIYLTQFSSVFLVLLLVALLSHQTPLPEVIQTQRISFVQVHRSEAVARCGLRQLPSVHEIQLRVIHGLQNQLKQRLQILHQLRE